MHSQFSEINGKIQFFGVVPITEGHSACTSINVCTHTNNPTLDIQVYRLKLSSLRWYKKKKKKGNLFNVTLYDRTDTRTI